MDEKRSVNKHAIKRLQSQNKKSQHQFSKWQFTLPKWKLLDTKKLAVIINFIIFKHKCHDISRGHQIEIVVHWPGFWKMGRERFGVMRKRKNRRGKKKWGTLIKRMVGCCLVFFNQISDYPQHTLCFASYSKWKRIEPNIILTSG